MHIGRLIGSGNVAEVFEAGADVLKLYRPGFGPEQAQREAMILDAIADLPLAVPRSLGVVEHEGRWGLLMSRMPGRPLAEQMEGPRLAAIVATLAALNRQIHAYPGAGLPSLKKRLADRIERASQLTRSERHNLLERLTDLPDGDRLCHGDFHPFNVIADGENLSVIDWLDATSGAPAADVGRTYLLAQHQLPMLAEPFLAARLRTADFGREAVMAWLPVLAGARLTENVPDETERLIALARAC